MVSIFPPKYALTPIFNVSISTIVEIIEKGYSDRFYNKAKKLLDKYNGSLGIDEEQIPFIKNIKRRCATINKLADPGKKVYYKDEIDKAISFLEEIVEKKENYFIDYVNIGRELKKTNKYAYIQHKTTSITYTPFGAFTDRENRSFKKSSGLLYFDVDMKMNSVEKKKMINFFLEDEYVKTAWVSFSGKGFGFLVESDWENEAQMKKNYYKLLEYFTIKLKLSYGINKRMFDTQVCSLSRMNFISNGLIKNKKKGEYKVFKTIDYSDELYNLLHLFYKKDSVKRIPNMFFTEDNVIKEKENFKKEKIVVDSDEYKNFLESITRNMAFTGNDDYNGAIKSYVSKVFRYTIDEGVLEQFLFEKIPYNRGTSKNFRRLWKCYSGYSSFRTVEPYTYKK